MNRIALSLAIPSSAFTLVVALGGGCAGELENPALFGPAVCSAPAIITKSCIGTCHVTGASDSFGNLDLQSPGLEERLVGKPGTSMCKGLLIDPDNPDESLLLTKLSASPPCGAPMPLAQPALSAAEVACIREWIVSLGSGSGGQPSAGPSGGGGAGGGGAGGGGT